MKTPIVSKEVTIVNIAGKVREAINRTNALLLDMKKTTKREKHDMNDMTQQMRGVLVGTLNPLNIFPEDAYERLYQYSIENDDETTYMEELLFLEHCIR